MVADLIFTGGRIMTLNADQPEAEALAVADGWIIAVGDVTSIRATRGPSTTVVEIAGKTLLPGFYDAHQHQVYAGLAESQINCRVESIAELCRRISEASITAQEGTWLEGRGYDESRFAEARHPTRHDLDRAAPRQPCFVTRTCGHAMVANSRALAAAAITRETPDPPGGIIERHPESAEPTGLLHEQAMQLIHAAVPQPGKTHLKRAIIGAANANLSRGITSVWEPSVEPDHVEAYRELNADDELPLRVTMAQKKILRNGRNVPLPVPFRGDRLSLVGVKLFQDGAIAPRTAALSSPYTGQPPTRGLLLWPQEELDNLTAEIIAARLQVSIHAIGDRAIRSALRALARARRLQQDPYLRHRIEHCGLPLDGLPTEIARVGVIPVLQPPFLHFHGEKYYENLGPARSEHLYPTRTLLDACGVVAGSSDGPVVPDLRPLRGIETAITRSTDQGRLLGAAEAVSLNEALAMYTYGAAFAAQEDAKKGMLTPGRLADLVVLNSDLIETPPPDISGVEVFMTVVGGEIVFRA